MSKKKKCQGGPSKEAVEKARRNFEDPNIGYTSPEKLKEMVAIAGKKKEKQKK